MFTVQFGRFGDFAFKTISDTGHSSCHWQLISPMEIIKAQLHVFKNKTFFLISCLMNAIASCETGLTCEWITSYQKLKFILQVCWGRWPWNWLFWIMIGKIWAVQYCLKIVTEEQEIFSRVSVSDRPFQPSMMWLCPGINNIKRFTVVSYECS